MKFVFKRPPTKWPCPFGNYPNIDDAPGFLTCDGVVGLIARLRKLLS